MIPTKTLPPPPPHPTYLMYCPYIMFNSNEPIKNAQLQSYERLKYIFPLDFAKYLSYLETQKNSKVDIRKKEVCS